jgi:alpha-L-rhamnosidase
MVQPLPPPPPLTSPLRATNLRVEDLDAPQLVDTARPRFSWQIESDRAATRQTHYELRIHKVDAAGGVQDAGKATPKLPSEQSQWVTWDDFTALPQSRYRWQVRITDNYERRSDWSEPATFETSLFDRPWPANWISDGRVVEIDEDPPARYLRHDFVIAEQPVRARLYLSAFGLAQPWLNGKRVTADTFLPGWPDYRKRNYYVSYEVTSLLHPGTNCCGIVLGDGWYSGTLFPTHQYGPIASVSGWLEITNGSGEIQQISTDAAWKWREGPITAQGIYFGETFDARRHDPRWSEAGNADESWHPVVEQPATTVPLQPRQSPPVRPIEEITPLSRQEVSPGVFIYDLGQNMVGWVRLKLSTKRGQEVCLRFAEMLDAEGRAYTKNLRKAEATARYIARGDDEEIWEPSFTFFGFRYVEVTGLKVPGTDAITGVVVHSDLERIGHFECSDPALNQLYSNTLWGQKGNFLELPTDCPQRDERLGWTGDAQVFAHTAHYNMRSGAFYRQWMAAVRDSFADGPRGGFGGVAPYVGLPRGAAGWSDAAAIVPWITWLHTADRRILAENFPRVQDWVKLQADQAPHGIRISEPGWGDWLAPGYAPEAAPTPYRLIATAYYAYSTQLAAQMAEVLEESDLALKYWDQWTSIKDAFRREFITADGRITSDEQTAYLLALGFDLVPAELRPAMATHLQRAVAEKDNHLSTGFLGTPLLTPILSRIGRTDLAYTVLQQQTYPGWLFSVKNGATTVWERWDSWTPEAGFNPGGMNSFNHYAYGSVVGWFYDTIAGLRPLADQPGWKEFAIAPQPGGGLTFAQARVKTPYGLVMSHWRQAGGRFEIDVTLPPNTRARVTLPATAAAHVTSNGKPLREISQVCGVVEHHGAVSFQLSSGCYRFTVVSPPPCP